MNTTAKKRRGRPRVILPLLAALLSVLALAVPARAADESIAVDFSTGAGAPAYRASGWIYGMTENASGPADSFYRDVKFRYMRAGGAQLDSPGGWVSGKYDRRWNSTRAQLLRTRALGKCVAVAGASTASGALLDQWTCSPVNQGSPLNQTWRLPGRQTT